MELEEGEVEDLGSTSRSREATKDEDAEAVAEAVPLLKYFN